MDGKRYVKVFVLECSKMTGAHQCLSLGAFGNPTRQRGTVIEGPCESLTDASGFRGAPRSELQAVRGRQGARSVYRGLSGVVCLVWLAQRFAGFRLPTLTAAQADDCQTQQCERAWFGNRSGGDV